MPINPFNQILMEIRYNLILLVFCCCYTVIQASPALAAPREFNFSQLGLLAPGQIWPQVHVYAPNPTTAADTVVINSVNSSFSILIMLNYFQDSHVGGVPIQREVHAIGASNDAIFYCASLPAPSGGDGIVFYIGQVSTSSRHVTKEVEIGRRQGSVSGYGCAIDVTLDGSSVVVSTWFQQSLDQVKAFAGSSLTESWTFKPTTSSACSVGFVKIIGSMSDGVISACSSANLVTYKKFSTDGQTQWTNEQQGSVKNSTFGLYYSFASKRVYHPISTGLVKFDGNGFISIDSLVVVMNFFNQTSKDPLYAKTCTQNLYQTDNKFNSILTGVNMNGDVVEYDESSDAIKVHPKQCMGRFAIRRAFDTMLLEWCATYGFSGNESPTVTLNFNNLFFSDADVYFDQPGKQKVCSLPAPMSAPDFIGAIIGGIVGSLVLIVAVVYGVRTYRQRNTHQKLPSASNLKQ